jgi:hypothetical protein
MDYHRQLSFVGSLQPVLPAVAALNYIHHLPHPYKNIKYYHLLQIFRHESHYTNRFQVDGLLSPFISEYKLH